MIDRSNWQVRRVPLTDQGQDDDLAGVSMADRIGMVWQLTVDAWAMKDKDAAQRRLPRDVVRLERRGR